MAQRPSQRWTVLAIYCVSAPWKIMLFIHNEGLILYMNTYEAQCVYMVGFACTYISLAVFAAEFRS